MLAEVLFKGGKSTAYIHCYLKWDRVSALADYIVRRAGTLDVQEYGVPKVRYLAADYVWPERYVLEVSPASA